MKQKRRTKRLLALALLLASVLGLAWASQVGGESVGEADTDFALQDQDAASRQALTYENWPLYEDPNYGFAIRHPPDWFVYPSSQSGDGNVATIANHPLNKVTMPTPTDLVKVEIGVVLYDKSPTQNLREWVKPADWMLPSPVRENGLSINGISSIRQTYLCGEAFNLITYIPRGIKVYFVSVICPTSTLSAELLTILASFTFAGPYSKPQKVVDYLYPRDILDIPPEDISLTAPSGFRLPFDGSYEISNGPEEGAHQDRAEEAVDFVMGTGTEVKATETGNVIFRGVQGCYGNIIGLQHDNGMLSWYAHLNEFVASDNQRVSKGQLIARSGATGTGPGCPSTGAHLHFHVRIDETPICILDLPGVWWNTSYPPGDPALYSGCASYPPSGSAPNECREGARTLSCDGGPTPPAAPSNLSASATSQTSIHLSWSNVDDEDGFKIFRDGSHIVTVGADTVSYDDNGLSCGTTYSYYVKAYNSAGESEGSDPASDTTHSCDTTPPSNPTSIWSTSHSRWSWSRDNTVEVCWSGASDGGGSGVDGYSYQWSTSSTTIPDTSKDVEESTSCVTSSPLSDGDNWYFHIRTRDNAGNWNSSATHYGPFWIDATGPDINWSGAATNQWYNSDQIVEWTLSDNRSGVAGFWQRWDNEGYSSFLPYSSGYLMLSWGGEGQRRAYIKAKDNAGNEREHDRGWFGYDVTPPTNPSITINSGAQYTNDPNVTLSLSASDSHSGVADVRLHNEGTGWSDWQSYATSKSWTLTAGDGTKTVTVQFRDAAGNESGTASDNIILDTTPPDTTITSGPQGDIPVGEASFLWTGSDNLTPTGNLVYSHRLRGLSDNWSAWSGDTNVSYSGLPEEDYTFEVKARDLAENEGDSPASRSFFVDTTPPDTTITSGPSGCIGTANVTFTWAGSDNRTSADQLQYKYRLEGFDADWSAWTSATSKSYTGLPDGDYIFKVKAQDGVGHEDPSPAAQSFRADTTPPMGSVLINGGDSTTNKITVHLDITGDDGPVGCGVTEMRLSNDGFNWEAWQPFAAEGARLLPILNRTTWTVHLQLKDLVGNVSGAFTDDIYLDLYPPRPSSENYQLGARVVASGDLTSTSESYGLLSATMGQPIADGRLQGADYRLESGYQGAWPSVPRGRPTPEPYDINASLVASSGGYQASESYRLQSTMGQFTDVGSRSSENYQLLSGYLPCKLFGDLDVNGRVNVADIMLVASKWRCRLGDDCYQERYDLDKDGDITVVDIMKVAAHWGETC